MKLSDDHPTVLTAMCGLARAYQSVGRRFEAIGLFEAALAKRRVKLGDDHPETLMTLFELAGAYSADEQHAERPDARARVSRSNRKWPAILCR